MIVGIGLRIANLSMKFLYVSGVFLVLVASVGAKGLRSFLHDDAKCEANTGNKEVIPFRINMCFE